MNDGHTAEAVSAAIYLRISDDKKGLGLGVERQEKDCRALAERLDWTVPRVYSDNDISAYSGKPRPGYKAMLADIKAGLVDAVIAWHPDRLHRSPKELETYIDVCESRRVPTHTVQAGLWDLSTPSGQLIARQLGAVARYESQHKAERVKAARIQSAQNGVWHGGKRPYGYTGGVGKSGRAAMQVIPGEAAEIRKMCDAIAQGRSLRSVVHDLNARGVVTSTGQQRWQTKTVREMLMRPTIAGYSVHAGKAVAKGHWEPIVDEETWQAVVDIMSNPSRATASRERLGRGPAWLGSGIYRCGGCGEGTMKVGSSSGSRKSYRCKNLGFDDRAHVSREATHLDAYVDGLLLDYLSKPGRVEKLLARDDSVDGANLNAELRRINAKKDALAAAYANDDGIDIGQLASASRVLDERAKVITSQLAEIGHQSPLAPLAQGNIRDLWSKLTLHQRRAILRVIVDITVKPMGHRKRGAPLGEDSVGVEWLVG
jgi:DNA invertase Pin-like site-specific DNA recombinase